jgi:polyhydroxyalkanoate synthesis regulator phasin
LPAIASLGRDLQEIAAATLHQAAAVRPLLDKSNVVSLDGLVKDAEADVCRIAVIGQVKAGKSSLINALIRRPRFLPTDVNPWTAVVTSLHFGESSGAGAVYQFFDERDWELLGSGGRLQELSLRLGVALDADTLGRQIRLMRDRAELRLGREFRQLLGQQHRFATASPEVLERYVCAGDLDRDAAEIRPGHSVGRFADITKSADLYLDLPPFAYPTIIIDTPGTNDPFLVRDQLSREVLDRADACMVVLNAQQALSLSDVGLLRLLRGLQKDRVLVFVNRIDQLGDPKAEGEAVLAHVRDKLAIEFPGSDIPVIIGSATWAEQALASEAAVAKPQKQREAIGTSPRRQGLEQAASPDAPEERAELIRRSGVDDLAKALSQMIVSGPTLLRLRRTQNALLEIVTKVDLAARDEIISLEQHIAAAREDAAGAARRQAQMADDLKRLGTIPSTVARLVDGSRKHLILEKDMALRRLDAELRSIVLYDAAAARDALLRRPFVRNEHAWRYDTSQTRRDLEEQFQTIYREAAEHLQRLERTTNAKVLNAIKDLMPRDALAVDHLPVNLIDPAPSISALGWKLAFELDEQWQAWWRLWHGQRQRAHKLEELLSTEFQATVEALVEAAATELSNHVAMVTNRFSKLIQDLVALLNRRKLDLETNRRDPELGRSTALLRRYQEHRSQLTERAQRCIMIATELEHLARRSMAIERPTRDALRSALRPSRRPVR